MRNALLFATAFLLLACGDIAPVETVDLCKGDNPPSNDCAQCKTKPFSKDCPRCAGGNPANGCENAVEGGSGGIGGGDGGNSGGGGGGGSGGGGGASGNGAQDGGSGGVVAMTDAGPDAAIDSGHACSGCKDGWDFCAGNECAQCLKENDCGDSLHCDKLGTHACVQCINDGQCTAQGMVCNEDKHTCVPCMLDSDCKDPKLPQCTSTNVCGPCTGRTACQDRDGFGSCDIATGSATKGQCVECLAHSECKNPKPQCNTKRECVACEGSDEACVDKDGTKVCDEDVWSEKRGQCVQCTGTKYAGCKQGSTEYVCDSATRACSTDHEKGKTANCKECISDAECLNGSACVNQEYGSNTFGPYCFPVDGSSGCADASNPDRRPFSRSKEGTSVDHQSGNYCFLATTCKAYFDASGASPKTCLTNSSPDNSRCGEPNITDGICPDSGPAMGVCSYVCQDDWDCPGVGSTSCGSNSVCEP